MTKTTARVSVLATKHGSVLIMTPLPLSVRILILLVVLLLLYVVAATSGVGEHARLLP